MPLMLRAIILDFDGVIADTEPLHYRAFATVFSAEGINLTERDYFSPALLGLNDAALVRAVFQRGRRPLSDDQCARILRAKDTAFAGLISDGLALLPGTKRFVEQAARRWPLAICSGAHRSEIWAILTPAGLLPCFKAIVSADDVASSKPDPAGYLETVRRLSAPATGLRPDQCLAVEDSLNGIRAARAAGMKTVAISSIPPSQAAREADDAVASLSELDEARMSRLFE